MPLYVFECWTCCIVEQHIRPPGREAFGFKRDAFGFGDILACDWEALG